MKSNINKIDSNIIFKTLIIDSSDSEHKVVKKSSFPNFGQGARLG